MSKILVVGASGFIGGRLIRHLSGAAGLSVRAASRAQREWPAGVEPALADVREQRSLVDACRGVDAVVNLVSMPEAESARNPEAAMLVTAMGAQSLAEAAAAGSVPRFVQVSTYKIYGSNPAGTLTEASPVNPESSYAIAHFAAEEGVRRSHPAATVFRLANGFGAPAEGAPGSWDLIVNGMCRDAVARRRIEIRSSGAAWRNFVPVEDVVRALEAACVRLAPDTYNLGAAESMTLRQMAARVAESCAWVFGFLPTVVTGPPKEEGPNRPLDFRIAKLAAAGFTPAASFNEELERTIITAGRLFAAELAGIAD